jgi:hypothetical protein
MMQNRRGKSALILACLLTIPLTACEDSETIPPEGSTITMAANPTTVVLGPIPQCTTLLQQATCGTSEVIATVRNELGIPLPGQDVRFSNTAGQLFSGGLTNPVPAANLPIETDSFGNARVGLITATTSTVTATSGNATSEPLTLNTVQGNLSQIVLTIDNSANSLCAGASSSNITSCNQEVCFSAEALDTSSMPIDGVTIVFSLENNTTMGNTLNGTFIPSQVVTGAGGDPGIARTKFTLNADCPQECSVSGGGGSCRALIVAETQGGFPSLPVELTTSIP